MDRGPAPLPASPPAVHMRWDNLLFLHWRVDPAAVRALIPAELELDVFNDEAWVALVPFRMEATRFRGFPPLPGLSSFFECNVRTYVRCGPHRGVWFFSLDAERAIPVMGGRWLWSLNYRHSRFTVSSESGRTEYTLARRADPSQRTSVIWRRGEALPPSAPGSIEHFLTERYWLFTRRRGRILGGQIHHVPWPLRSARVERVDDTLIRAAGLDVSGEPLAHHVDSIDVKGWGLRSLRAEAAA